MRRRSSFLALASIAAAGLFAGCGSGGSSSTTAKAPAEAGAGTLPGYLAEADALCKSENERLAGPGAELEAVLRKSQGSGELATAAGEVREFGAEVKRGLNRFASLEPPAARRGEVEAVIATQARQIDLFGELAEAFETEDRTAAQEVETRLVAGKRRYGMQTAELGYKVCGVRSR
jgi:hypothetical protein